MAFQSFDFLIFFALVWALYWRLPRRGQNALLLGASVVFYGWVHPWFVLLLATSALTDFVCAQRIEDDPVHRRRWLGLSLVVNLGMLGVFKYFGFFVDNVAVLLEAAGLPSFTRTFSVVLPVGISFYTFQTISYTVDVYRQTLRARRDLLDYAVYVSFFPQLVAGPIERADRLLPQIERDRRLSPEQARDGLFLMVWGFFKKLVVADNLAVTVEKVFLLEAPTFSILWVGVFAFGMQIYADFSGYTDIARGAARLLGIDLVENFRHPYLSRSPAEFWRRWHITLSEWFRDYVYIPLGGSRVGGARSFANVIVVFGLSGLWHGASWNFLLWGLYWAALLLLHRAWVRVVPDTLRGGGALWPLQVGVMFVLAHVGWLLFRQTDVGMIGTYLTLSPTSQTPLEGRAALYLLGLVAVTASPLAVDSVRAAVDERWPRWGSPDLRLALHTVAMAACLLGIIVLAAPSRVAFIYFQF